MIGNVITNVTGTDPAAALISSSTTHLLSQQNLIKHNYIEDCYKGIIIDSGSGWD